MKNNGIKPMPPAKKFKLAYVIGTYPILTTTFIDREIQILRELGVTIQPLSIRRPPKTISQIEKYAEIQKDIIYLMPVNWVQFILANLYFILRKPAAYLKTLLFLFTRPHPSFLLRLKTLLHFAEGVFAAFYLRDCGCDHVHAHFVDRASIVALCVGRLLELPYSQTAHARNIFEGSVLIYEKIAESKFTVTVSKFNKNYLLDKYPNLDPNKIIVLHPWINLSQFQPPPNRPVNSCFRIVSVGRLVEKKGHQFLIESCHLLQKEGIEFECFIIGDGPLKAELEQMVADYNLENKVYLLGGLPQPAVFSYLSQADLFVLPCVIAQNGDRDGMPVALAEAMAMEIPVISTDIVGIKEMVQPGAGYLVPERDAVALAKALKTVFTTSQLSRVEMGKYGRTIIAEEFDLFTGIHQLADLFEESVNQHRMNLSKAG